MIHNPLRYLRVVAGLVAMLAACSTTSADLIISFGTSTPDPIPVGSSGTLDVFVRASAGTRVSLDAFQLSLTIGGAGVIFPTTQSTAYLTLPTYVFSNQSLSFNTNVPVGFGDNGSNYDGYDAKDGPLPLVVDDLNNLLLARVDLTGVSPGTFAIDAINSSFVTDQLDAFNSAIPFTSTAGSVTVAAVPEPSVAWLGAVLLTGLELRRRFWPWKRSSVACCP